MIPYNALEYPAMPGAARHGDLIGDASALVGSAVDARCNGCIAAVQTGCYSL